MQDTLGEMSLNSCDLLRPDNLLQEKREKEKMQEEQTGGLTVPEKLACATSV